MRRISLTRRLALAIAAAALVAGATTGAKAAPSYAFAEQTISGLTLSPTVTPAGPLTTVTLDGTTLNGLGTAQSNPLNVLQAYQGGAPPAPEDFYARYAPGNPPVSPVAGGTFTRGDAIIASLGQATNSSSVVAESYLPGPGTASATGAGGLNASITFLPTVAGPLMLTYNYSNRAFVNVGPALGGGNATADYHFTISIKDSAGTVVFNSSTANTNLSLSAPPNGAEVIRSGTETVTTPALTLGTTYTVTFSSTAQTSVTTVIPEPASMSLFGIGTFSVLALARVRNRKAKA